jgi:phosphatidate cytidylyltransferase
MFITRLISGIVLVAIALVTIMTGNWLLYATVLILSVIGMRELYKACKVVKEDESVSLPELGGYIGMLLFYGSIVLKGGKFQLAALLAGLIILMFIYVFGYPKYDQKQVMAAFFGIVYVGVMLSYIYQTRMLPGGKFHVWLIFLCSWGCDTCAYCVGVLFGKHKMAPVLSPKKSIEGAVGGIAGAVLLGIIYGALTHGPILEYAGICCIGALISMVGDLAASAIKRNVGIKDYGKLIPGHGGILDRFDSVIFTAPIIYFLSVLWI